MVLFKQKKVGPRTQDFLQLKTIRDGVVITKNKFLRGVIMASGINFALKSSAEQEAIIYRYQEFLNSLDFPIQIIINSRKLKIDEYLDLLQDLKENQKNELLQIQTAEYIEFIKSLLDLHNIMTKNFFIVVPMSPQQARVGMGQKIMNILNPKAAVTAKKEMFDIYKDQLWQRMDHIITALLAMGIRAVPLNTQELIELFFRYYNPGESTPELPAEEILEETD